MEVEDIRFKEGRGEPQAKWDREGMQMECGCCGKTVPIKDISLNLDPTKRWQLCHFGWDSIHPEDECRHDACPECVSSKGGFVRGPMGINHWVYICGCHTWNSGKRLTQGGSGSSSHYEGSGSSSSKRQKLR